MALITLPAKFGFTRVERFALVRNSNILRSRFTGQGQRVTYPYAVWEFEGRLVEYDGPEAAAIRSFLVQLDGVENTFKLPVPGYTKPTGVGYNGAGLVVNTAANARATSLNVSVGYGTSLTQFLRAGDYFTINDELKVATADLNIDVNGNGVLYFKSALRKPVAVNQTLTLKDPYCLMHATEDDVANWALTPPIRHGIEFRAIEAVDI